MTALQTLENDFEFDHNLAR